MVAKTIDMMAKCGCGHTRQVHRTKVMQGTCCRHKGCRCLGFGGVWDAAEEFASPTGRRTRQPPMQQLPATTDLGALLSKEFRRLKKDSS